MSLNKSNGALKSAADAVATMFNAMTEAMKSETQKQDELINEGVAARRKSLNQEIEGWMVLGNRKKAIQETMRQLDLRNPNVGNSKKEINTEANILSGMEYRRKELTEKGKGYNRRTYEEGMELDALVKQIKAQKEIVFNKKLQVELYEQSVQFLNEELATTEKLYKKTPPGKREVSDEDRKAWQKQDAKDKRELSFQDSIDRSGEDIRSQIYKIGQSADFTMPVIIKPEYEVSAEVSDITGSIVDYQQRIQDVTLAYNEATTDGLRAMYAKQRSDLEKHLQEMTDVNEGMIDISNELNNLIQSGVVQGFESLGEAIAAGDAGEAMRGMLIGLMDMLKQFGTALVAAGLAKIAFDKLSANPYAAIAAGGALIIATTVAKASLSKVGDYAEGGIAPYFTVGDRMLAGVNGGEMILNTGQQAKLFDLLDLGRSYVNNSERELSGRLVADGSSLVAVIDSHMKKQRRGR